MLGLSVWGFLIYSPRTTIRGSNHKLTILFLRLKDCPTGYCKIISYHNITKNMTWFNRKIDILILEMLKGTGSRLRPAPTISILSWQFRFNLTNIEPDSAWHIKQPGHDLTRTVLIRGQDELDIVRENRLRTSMLFHRQIQSEFNTADESMSLFLRTRHIPAAVCATVFKSEPALEAQAQTSCSKPWS